ncbi:MAG: DEAD/DEAH box helicase family protein [Clostridia bacterium]|nr:DEAD/DEAH box helicase family protein [Clostridia bacterium]
MDRTYEQPQTFRRRGSAETVSSQLSLFDLIENEDVAVSMAREAERLTNTRPAFSISQEIIDKVLSDGTNEKESLLMISAEFSKNKPLADKVEFLKNHYGIDGKGFIFDERKVTAWWNKDGMRISYGSSTRDNFTQELSWEDVARRIDELLDIGRFAPTDVLIQIPEYLYNRTADRFWDMRRDMNFDEYPELNNLFTDSVYNSTGSYPDNVSRIEAYLKTPKGLDDVNELMKKICALYDENSDIVRFRGLNNPHRVANLVEDLYIPRKEYTAETLSYVPPVRFISEDEIDNIFRGGTGMQDGRYRVYNYFAEHPEKQERIAFLKKEYGTGGSYNGKRNEDHDGKGIRFNRGQLGNPVAEVHIKWNEAEKRIDKLIKQGRYLTEKDIKNIPDYERNEVAQAIYYAFHNRIQDGQYRPYPSDMDYYGDAMKAIAEKIKLPAQMEEIFEELNILLSETLPDDRDYEWRIRARDTLEKYMEGNFNLFPGIDRPAPNSVKDLKEAMRVINEYSKEEFEGDEADFSDLTSVSLAFTETEDGKHFIDVEADLINHKIIRSIDNQLVEELKYGSLSELIEKELYGMSFDDLVYFTDEQLAPFYQSPDALMEEANMLQDYFIYSKADDIAVSVQNETVVAADGENEWKGKEIYDFILNEMLAFNEDGTLADGLTVPEEMLEFIKKTGAEKYGVEYAVIIEVDEPEQEAFADFLARIHAEDDGKTVALLPLGDFYESYGADAEAIAETLNFQTTHKTVEGVEYALCGFPKHRLEENVEVLTEKGFDVILVDDDGNPHKVISRDKALGLPESTAPTEVIEEPDEAAPEEVPEGLRWDEGTAMRIAQEEWEKAHRPPVHRPTYEQRNYNFMREFAPQVLEGSVRYALYESKGFMPLHISSLYDNSIRIAHTYEMGGDTAYDPEMIFEIDEDNEALKPLEYRQDNMGVYQVVGENVSDRELSSFAVQWFKNIRSQGFHLAQERLEYADADIEVSYNEKGEIINVEGEENAVALYIEENAVEFPVDETAELVGKEITIDDRRFIVDSVNREFDTVSLKDITFQEGTGFPIFRRENVEFVKAALEQQKDAEKIVPEFERVQPSKVANTVVYPEIPMAQRTNFVIDNDELGYGGAKEKFRKNMEAIRVLKECEFEHRLATPEEQQILSEYVGWGGLADAFDETKPNWSNEFQELYAALSPEEYEQARASTLTSHYTSPVIIKSMYKALENMGFNQGNILEPSCGIGNFMGLVPESMKDSKIYGIELDSITGRIAQQLYQRNSVAIQGYEDTTLPDSFFDVAIGNVPFGDYKLSDKKYNKHNFLIHDYFFAKTLDKVRPGGIVAFITSSGTMDKRNSKVRQYIAQRADLVGAIRLPNNAFLKNAGTEVTADILFLQKRDRMTDIMPDWVHLGTLENGIAVNQYFADNPDMILGEMQMVSGPFGPTPTCMPYEDVPLSEQLNEAIQNIHATITEYEIDDVSNDEELTIPADPEVRNFSFTLVDGDVYFRENSLMRKVELNATAQNRIKGMIAIRDCVRTLIEYQTEGYPDWEIQKQQEKLNTIYDDFTKKYGLINSRGNSMAFSDDSSYFLLCSLEVLDENGELERKADMFTKRTIGAKTEVTKVDTSSEALAVSIGEKAKIDMELMSSLTGKTEEELYEDLKGVIFLNPHYNEDDEPAYLTADEYLSGNVREKLAVVKDLAVHDEAFKINVEALEKVQPKDLTASEITVRLGSTWIPPEDIKQFVFELLSPGYYARDKIEVNYSNITGDWSISNKSYDKGVKATNTFGTHRINAYKIIEESLNLKDVRIFDYVEDEEGKKKPVLNKKETMIAQQKQDLIKAEFDNWIWKNPDRRERLTKLYNEKFNSNRPREYDGSHITFSGMNPEIVLRKHQEDAVARIMYGGNSLLGHVVGAGKTWTMVAAAMESKRLGLCNKSLFVVPNHLTEQWASEFLQLYPAANILVATKKDFETKNRKKFCGRIATGDYDAVIIGHSQFEKIPMSVERQIKILERQRQEIMHGIIEAKAQKGERFTIKQLEKSRKSIENKLEKLNDQSRKDDVVTFEEIGVDRIFVDEAHYYKNLYLYTKMRNVGGISQTEAQKSSDLFMKTQYLDELTGGKGVIFATGTPVSNSMVELYTMQRYLQYKTLQDHNLQHFDAWASTFGETITAIELAPEGTGYRAKTRFAKFFNLPELMAMFKDVADIQTADMLNLPTPTPHYKTIAVEPTEIQKEMVSELADRAEKVRNKMVDPSVDNMLKITNDGRKLALDQRLMNPLLPDDESSKVSACAKEVFDIWEQTSDIKGTQLVFCDLSTPKNDGTFNVYSDIRDKLIANGVPESEIEFIHNAETEVKKKELFSKVRKGDVRILLGSTPKMGAGTNVQRLLYASHDLDCPWRPADLEQRAGRIIRQGNTNSDVHIRRYVTKDTFDSYMWQLVENKQKFIGQIMTSKSPVRSAEDIDEMALSYAEIKALTTGNPYIKEKMDLDTQVAKLKLIKSSFMSQKYELEDKVIKEYPRTIADLTERIKGFEGDIAIAEKYPKQEDVFYPMTIDGLPYTDKEKAGTALLERCKKMTSPEPTPIGDYRGFSMDLSFDTTTKVFYVALKGHLSHKVELGTDVFGNLQRLDNALEGLPKRLEVVKGNLEETKKQFETAKVESQKEFPQEAELQEKIKRLAEVEVLLDMDKKDKEGADLGEPEENEIPQKKVVGLER